MKTRVEITGIDTAELPVLTHEESMNLLKRAQAGDKKAHDEFVTANLRLVLSIVQRFYGRKACADDLFQVGCVGLIKAMKNFNTEYNLRFSTYAVPMIIGEIRRFLRDGSALRVSRSLRDRAYKALQVRHDLETTGNGEATCEEIAACMNVPVREVTFALDAIADPVSLYDPVYHDGDETVMVMDQIADGRYDSERWLGNIAVSEAMERLPERERKIISLRFYEGRTQMEVSEEIGISQAQVSRLEKSAINRLREYVQE